MKLNPSKCVFGVIVGKFLGFMVFQRGIEVNLEKVKVIMELAPPRTMKKVQSLNGKIAALNRFVLRATDKCLPFFRTLRKSFEWTNKCQKAFEDLKAYLSSLPLLSPSKPGEELFLYLAVSPAAVSAALIREEDKDQGAKEAPMWSIYTDGSSNKHAGGVGVVLHTLEGDKIECVVRLDFSITNNKAKYEALIAGLDLTLAAGAKSVVVYSDSQVVTSQVNRIYECKDEEEVSSEHCWMTPIAAYLKEGKLPDDKEAARKLKGLDIMGPFPTAVRQLKFLVVGIDYFTKWVEAKALATIMEKKIRSFVWRNIICRYGIPRVLVSDNGNQFDNDAFRDFCSQLGIKTTTRHPPTRRPMDRTTTRTPTGGTSFRLAYGSEAVIPAEVGLTSFRVGNYDESKNDEAMRL
ncbi:uncharacterized protein LOC142620843 [Castanea sativa]|uniref:uncharacterized protein LOC142620843 n=1 Tax=Castanea sativa TaxID=21020 RepID=UPI003F64A003